MLSARSGSEGILLPFNFFKNTPILSPGCLEACQLIVCCLYSLCNITNGRLNFRVAMKRNAQSIKYLPILLSPSSLFTIMAVIFSIENCQKKMKRNRPVQCMYSYIKSTCREISQAIFPLILLRNVSQTISPLIFIHFKHWVGCFPYKDSIIMLKNKLILFCSLNYGTSLTIQISVTQYKVQYLSQLLS